MNSLKRARYPTLLFCFMLLFFLCASIESISANDLTSSRQAHQGFLDLSEWNFHKKGTVKLAGEWLMYWGRLIDPHIPVKQHPEADIIEPLQNRLQHIPVYQPEIWNNIQFDNTSLPGQGFATFTLSLIIPETYLGRIMGLRLTHVYTAYQLYADGVLVAENGTVGITADRSVPQYLPQVAFFVPESPVVNLVMHISNFDHRKGGMAEPVELGTNRQVLRLRERRIIAEMLTVGILGIIGLYHFMIFLLRKKEKSALFFSLYCFAICLRTLLMGERLWYFLLPDFPWILGQKLDYLTIFLSYPLLIYFFHSLFPLEMNKKVPLITAIISAFFGLIVIVTPAIIFTRTLTFFFPVIVITGVYAVYILFLAASKQRAGAKILLGGGLLFFLTAINDILYNYGLIRTTYLSTTGLVLFTITQTMLLSYLFTRAYNMIETINISLWRFVPREVLTYLGKQDIIDIRLGDQVHGQLAVLFSDIRDFTKLSEQMRPDENFNFINAFLEYTGPVIRKHGGFIDKYIGDAIMAIFPTGSAPAVKAAIDLRRETLRFNADHEQYHDVDIGISINTGTIMLGIVGEKERLESTVISDVVNVASRLEGLNKEFGAGITVSGSVYTEIKDHGFSVRYLGKEHIRGRTGDVSVYEVLDGDSEAVKQNKLLTGPDFKRALKLFEQGDTKTALELLQNIHKQFPQDKAVSHLIKKFMSE